MTDPSCIKCAAYARQLEVSDHVVDDFRREIVALTDQNLSLTREVTTLTLAVENLRQKANDKTEEAAWAREENADLKEQQEDRVNEILYSLTRDLDDAHWNHEGSQTWCEDDACKRLREAAEVLA